MPKKRKNVNLIRVVIYAWMDAWFVDKQSELYEIQTRQKKSEQDRIRQNNTEQDRTRQNKTEQDRTKHNKT